MRISNYVPVMPKGEKHQERELFPRFVISKYGHNYEDVFNFLPVVIGNIIHYDTGNDIYLGIGWGFWGVFICYRTGEIK